MRIGLVLLTMTMVACGGKPGPGVGVDPGPGATVQHFMQAVADSNLNRMAELWGTSKGPAATTHQPSDYQKRVAIIWAYLRGSTARVMGEIERTDNRSVLAVEVSRADCRKRVPFTMVRTGSGSWVINAIELALVGVPGSPCASEDKKPRP